MTLIGVEPVIICSRCSLGLIEGGMVMEVLTRLGSLLSPSFFAILAGLSLTAAAFLFVAGTHNAAGPYVTGTKLSELEPTEYRGTGYLVLTFVCSMIGLILSFIFAAIGTSFGGSLICVILLLLFFIFTLCFLYAGGGTLFGVVTGQWGRVTYWFFPFMRYIDTAIVRFGDLITTGLFRLPRRQRIVTEIGGLAEPVKETPATVMPGEKKAKPDKDMERLQYVLAEYEAQLTPEQREKFVKLRRIAEELRSMYP